MKKLTGRCLCEAVAYEVSGELGTIYNCHCSKCRRWHGAAFRTRAAVKSEKFKWTKGEEHISKYVAGQTTRTFCSVCGSNLISYFKENPEYIGLPIGGLEQDPGNKPYAHIFVGSKAPWHEVTDQLPQYEEWPAGGPDKVRTGAKPE